MIVARYVLKTFAVSPLTILLKNSLTCLDVIPSNIKSSGFFLSVSFLKLSRKIFSRSPTAKGFCHLTLSLPKKSNSITFDFNFTCSTRSVVAHVKLKSNVMEFDFLGKDRDRKSTRLNSSHDQISYAVFCLKKKNL